MQLRLILSRLSVRFCIRATIQGGRRGRSLALLSHCLRCNTGIRARRFPTAREPDTIAVFVPCRMAHLNVGPCQHSELPVPKLSPSAPSAQRRCELAEAALRLPRPHRLPSNGRDGGACNPPIHPRCNLASICPASLPSTCMVCGCNVSGHITMPHQLYGGLEP
jgi:hypothetical protein